MENRFEDVKINIKVKLSALWASLVLIYLYADLFGFYILGDIDEVIDGELAGMPITPVLLLSFMILMTIPSLMVFLSLILKAKANRWTNIIVGMVQLVLVLASGFGDPNIYFVFASGVETVILLLIVWYAWKWPTGSE